MKLRQDRHIRCAKVAKRYLRVAAKLAGTPHARRAMEKAQLWTRRALIAGKVS
jgi:hypothetical protein